MAIEKGDFVEIDFTGKIKDTDEVFDTTDEKKAKDAGLNIKDVKPFTLSIGHGMLPLGFDSDLSGKEIGKEYTLELTPKKAFGKRDKSLIKMVPTKLFLQQNINPERGMQLNLDGQIVKILSNSGGRTLIDFNNPLAGKDIIYIYKINKKIDDEKEKVNVLQDFLLRNRYDFEQDEKKITFFADEKSEPMIKMVAPKFKEILNKEVEVKKKSTKKDAS